MFLYTLIMTHMTHYYSYDLVWRIWLGMTQYDSVWLIWLTVTHLYLVSSSLQKPNIQYIRAKGVVALKLMGSTWLMWVIWLIVTCVTHMTHHDSDITKISIYAWYLMHMRQRDPLRHVGHVSSRSYGTYKWHEYERSYEHQGMHPSSLSIIAGAGNHKDISF